MDKEWPKCWRKVSYPSYQTCESHGTQLYCIGPISTDLAIAMSSFTCDVSFLWFTVAVWTKINHISFLQSSHAPPDHLNLLLSPPAKTCLRSSSYLIKFSSLFMYLSLVKPHALFQSIADSSWTDMLCIKVAFFLEPFPLLVKWKGGIALPLGEFDLSAPSEAITMDKSWPRLKVPRNPTSRSHPPGLHSKFETFGVSEIQWKPTEFQSI